MSVRHVHAKRGQYIRVHRDYGGSGGGDDAGCFSVILAVAGIALVIAVVMYFWKVILITLLSCLALWLLWVFRSPIWAGICYLAAAFGNWISAPPESKPGKPYMEDLTDYGKIRQRHR